MTKQRRHSEERSDVESPRHPERSEGSLDEESQDDPKIPWHFWIGVGLVGVYLGYRVIQLTVMGFTNLF